MKVGESTPAFNVGEVLRNETGTFILEGPNRWLATCIPGHSIRDLYPLVNVTKISDEPETAAVFLGLTEHARAVR